MAIVSVDGQEIEIGDDEALNGVQVAARHWREDVVLAVMGALEQASGPVVNP
ncbi:MAG: hypothetical protein GY783_08935 [Gammaproteobacteria bacterium]|nr:hypothetical protein [Gammaproteobacteria bacterium]